MADSSPVRDFASTQTGEWSIVNGDFPTVAGAVAVPQGIRIRVGMFLGEAYLDETIGVDYLGSILIKDPDPLVVRSIIQEAIADTPDVTNVYGADVTQSSDRNASVNYVADSVYSTAPFSDSIGVP